MAPQSYDHLMLFIIYIYILNFIYYEVVREHSLVLFVPSAKILSTIFAIN